MITRSSDMTTNRNLLFFHEINMQHKTVSIIAVNYFSQTRRHLESSFLLSFSDYVFSCKTYNFANTTNLQSDVSE